jgi:hypothetical protein
MQSSMIPWHIFLNALAQQGGSQEKYWLDRWRFTNDGVFMAHEKSDAKRESHLPEGSIQAIGKQERFVN